MSGRDGETWVWADGTIYDPSIPGYRQATADELRRNCHVPLREAAGSLNLDLAHEDAPDPRWLRQLAATLKLEADLLKGHSEAMPANRPTRAAVAILAAVHMGQASDCLTQLADLIDDPSVATLPIRRSALAINRRQRDMTQAELARRAGVTTAVVSRLERGVVEPSWPTARNLAVVLRVNPLELFPDGCAEADPPAVGRPLLESEGG